MAATVTLGKLLDILAEALSNLKDNTALVKASLKRVKARGGATLPNSGTHTIDLISSTEEPMRLVAAHVSLLVTQAAGANSKSYQIHYDDGAAGSDTALSSLYDGTATAITQDRRNAFTVTAGVIIPVGSRVFATATTNGTPTSLEPSVEAEFAVE